MEIRYSVVIPVYNVKKYLDECLQSILCQIFDYSAEIIIVDDGSTDGSETICDDYQVKYPNIVRVYHNSNHGLLFTRRYGFKHSKGEYIVNCDSDDTLQPDFFEKLDTIINKYSTDVIIFNMNKFDSKGISKLTDSIFTSENTTVAVDKETVFKEFISTTQVVSMCTKVCRKDCLDLSDTYNRYNQFNHAEDTLQSIEIFEHANSIIYLNQNLYNYRISTGMTHFFDEKYFENFKSTFEIILEKKSIFQFENFDIYFARKLYSTVSRAITQLGYAKQYSYKEEKQYLEDLGRQELIKNYSHLFSYVKKDLGHFYYSFLLEMLFDRKYWMIIVALKLRNMFR